jgi:hypothetical protein
MCHIMDRIGGKKIQYDLEDCEESLRELALNFRGYSKSKTAFINKEHRETEKISKTGESKLVAAPKTGANWFKGAGGEIQIMSTRTNDNTTEEDVSEEPINPVLDTKLSFEKKHTRFVRFDGRYFDNDLHFDDYITLLVPPTIEPSNILLFELILLQSDTVPKDYVVSWGVFPLVNSEFELNQGKFKVPMLFGGMNLQFDKFGRLEEQYKNDLDNWLCNLYFEVERIKLSEIKIHPETKDMYHNFHKGQKPATPSTPTET